MQPILVDRENRLIAGRNRLAACQHLGWEAIPAFVVECDDLHRELMEIDENLVRHELTVMERAEQLRRRKAIYEELHPETRPVNERGGPGRGNKTSPDSGLVFRPKPFVEETAEKTGRSRTVVAEEVQIAESLDDEVKEAIRDTPLADHKTELIALARLPKDEQKAVVEAVASGEVESVRQALSHREPEAREQREARSHREPEPEANGLPWGSEDEPVTPSPSLASEPSHEPLPGQGGLFEDDPEEVKQEQYATAWLDMLQKIGHFATSLNRRGGIQKFCGLWPKKKIQLYVESCKEIRDRFDGYAKELEELL